MKEHIERLSLWRELLDGLAINFLLWTVIIVVFLLSGGFIFKVIQALTEV